MGWSDSDDEETAPLGPPPGTFGCQMPPLQWVPVPVPVMGQIPGRSCLGETDVKGCRTGQTPKRQGLPQQRAKKGKANSLEGAQKSTADGGSSSVTIFCQLSFLLAYEIQ